MKISDELLNSNMWKELRLNERGLYLTFLLKGRSNITLPFKEYCSFVNERTFIKILDSFITKGLVQIIEQKRGSDTVYKVSENWKNDVEPKLRAGRVFTETHKKGLLKSLIKINTNSIKTATKGHVYIVKNDIGLYKIGYSVNVDSRLKALSKVYGNLLVVKLIESDHISSKERELHERFKTKRLPNCEWFKLDSADVLNI